VRAELRLAVAEVRDELSSGARRIAFLAAGLVALLWGALLGSMAAVSALSRVVEPWLAFLIVALVCALTALVLLRMAARASTPMSDDDVGEHHS
jgi:membrane protein implicated in regulation of membrane protease activity